MVVFGVLGLAGEPRRPRPCCGGRRDNLNVRAAFLEVANDALGSVAVLVAAGVIATTGWLRADAVVSLVIGALIIPRTLKLLAESVNVLLESTPKGLDLTAVRQRLMTNPHVQDVHDLHATQVATGLPVLTAHVVVHDSCFHDGHLARCSTSCSAAWPRLRRGALDDPVRGRSHAAHEHRRIPDPARRVPTPAESAGSRGPTPPGAASRATITLVQAPVA